MSFPQPAAHFQPDWCRVTLSSIGDAVMTAEAASKLQHPYLILDADLRVASASVSFLEAFNVEESDTVGRLVYEIGEGQWNIPALRNLLEDVLPCSHSFENLEVEHDFPAVGRRELMLNAYRLEDTERPEHILLAIEDVTDRRPFDRSLRYAETRHRRVYESTADGILVLDGESYKIIDSNPSMTRLLGYTRDEFLGKELWEVGIFDTREQSAEARLGLEAKRYIRVDHLTLTSKTGDIVDVEFGASVYRAGASHVVQCTIHDISEKCRLERKTIEQAKALAEVERRKDEFLAMLSHELRNPLAPILNAVQLLQLRGDGDGLQREAHAIIERQVGQLSRLIDDLMDVSRITTGRVILQPEQTLAGDIVERAIESVRPLIDRRSHKLNVSIVEEPIYLYADAARLEQILVNILNNAAKYTANGGTISLDVRVHDTECVFRIEDNGPGIAPELLPLIFELFTQSERTLDRAQGGLGIGLAIARQLVVLHGGAIEAESTEGKGTTLVIRLPVDTQAEFRSAVVETESQDRPSAPLRVLIVEDNVNSAQVIGLLAEFAGHRVQIAHDGPTALSIAANFHPDAVILDIGLPGMSGYDVAKSLRSDPQLSKVLLIAMTGYGQPADRERTSNAGFNAHLVKPVDFKTLSQALSTEAADLQPTS